MNHLIGIYLIRNKINEKVYVGSSVNVESRLKHHQRSLMKGVHNNSKLQNAFNKYEFKNFSFVWIENVNDLKKLIRREQYWIDHLDSVSNGYNIRPKAGHTFDQIPWNKGRSIRKGYHLSEETKRKISMANKGKKRTLEQRKRISEGYKYHSNSEAITGRKLSKKHRRAISQSGIGRKVSEETKRKIGESNKKALLGNIPWNKGLKNCQVAWNKGLKGIVKFSEETKKKQSESARKAWKKRRRRGGVKF
ncbi:putative GIY-YIG domain-containing protein [Gammaproteobacteria bacterium]